MKSSGRGLTLKISKHRPKTHPYVRYNTIPISEANRDTVRVNEFETKLAISRGFR